MPTVQVAEPETPWPRTEESLSLEVEELRSCDASMLQSCPWIFTSREAVTEVSPFLLSATTSRSVPSLVVVVAVSSTESPNSVLSS